MGRPSVVEVGFSGLGGRDYDEVVIAIPQEICRHHPEIGVMEPASILWSKDVKVISLGFTCRKDTCNYTLKVLRDL